MQEKLPIDAKVALIQKMLDDFSFYTEHGSCPLEQNFTIVSSDEHRLVETGARYSALREMDKDFQKTAFDTRRIDQELDVVPRINLQNWHRTDKFIDDETTAKLGILDKLHNVVKDLKDTLGNQPEWLDSYARLLSNSMDRLRVKQAGDDFVEVFKPHVSYVEQLVYNRYRLSLNEIRAASPDMLRNRILSKDDSLNKRRDVLISTGANLVQEPKKTADLPTNQTNSDAVLNLLASVINKNNDSQNKTDAANDKIIALLAQAVNKPEQPKDALSALFGNGVLRASGEKSVERTITIKIVDTVKDDGE